MAITKKNKSTKLRFGIGEWYGVPLVSMRAEDRRAFAEMQDLPKSKRPVVRCPFQVDADCNKPGGVCSLQRYEQASETGEVSPADGEPGQLRTVCPARFEERSLIYRWVSEVILGSSDRLVIGEVGFLEPPASSELEAPATEVGRIDRVLALRDSSPLSWCALEVQAVYFQGRAMKYDFGIIRDHVGAGLPFPRVTRRPDYRSSGPKRLMPQLQIKVPSLRRWGKKMAVVVDRSFFRAMGKMRTVSHISNCDVAWFVVRYDKSDDGRIRLVKDGIHFTTLEDSVEGLTAGVPVSLEVFEKRIFAKIERLSRPIKIAPDQ